MRHQSNWEKKKRQGAENRGMGIQVLQYEFMGPIPLDEWGPPMEKLVYLILARNKDRFNIIYAGDCEKTEDKAFFVQHSQFKCWADQAGSERSLYLAIFPMFGSGKDHRQNVLQRIITHYKPGCNESEIMKEKPGYAVRGAGIPDAKRFNCPCCGSEMNPEQILEKSTIYRCKSCGMSDTRLSS